MMNRHDEPVPDHLYHYYDESTGPFCNLSDMPLAEAQEVQASFASRHEYFASRRAPGYVETRFGLEDRLRDCFISLGGRPVRSRPHYLTLGRCDWLLGWYPDPRFVRVALRDVDPAVVSFTYGDLFPAFRWDPPPMGGRVLLIADLAAVIAERGLPQDVNSDGALGPLRYIEAQLWSDEPLSHLRRRARVW
ncbi:MAG: hypothetical protein ACOC2N_04040 [Spirochaetota bacterium]